LVRVAAPTEGEICDVLARSGKKEGWPLAKELNMRIAKESGRNLRRALLMYEAVHAQKYVPDAHAVRSDIDELVTVRKSQTQHRFHRRTGKP
jgi:hypothetical protein